MNIQASNKICIFIAIGAVIFTSATQPAVAADRETRTARNIVVSRSGQGSRLVIWRIASLGNQVIVDLRIDGVPAGSIGWGEHYEGILRPGRHVLSVIATPAPQHLARWEITLDVQAGRTYNFTAKSGTGGQLILKRT